MWRRGTVTSKTGSNGKPVWPTEGQHANAFHNEGGAVHCAGRHIRPGQRFTGLRGYMMV